MTPAQLTAIYAAFVGIALQLLYKAYKLQQKAKISNQEFSILKWMKDDWIAMVLNVGSPFIVVWMLDEWLELDEAIMTKIKSLFIFVGFGGSQVIMGFLSFADKKFNKVIDAKTNAADGVEK